MIKKIRIRRFRSIDDMTIDFGTLTTLVGRNDVGKSNVARALNLFFHGETDIGRPFNFARDYNRNSTVPAKKAKEVVIEITFELPSSFKDAKKDVIWKKTWRIDGIYDDGRDPIKFSDKKKVPSGGKIRTAIQRHYLQFAPAIKDMRFFAGMLGNIYDQLSSDKSGKIKMSGDKFNVALRDAADGLMCGLRDALGEDFSVSLPENLRPIFENLDIKNAEDIPFDRRGDGIKVRHIPELFRFLATLLNEDFGQPGAPNPSHIWIFEEPENNLEFAAAFHMIERIKDILASDANIQILMTTHSPVFYGLRFKNDVRHFISIDKNKFTLRKPISEEAIDEEMGLLPVIAKAIEPIREQLEAVKESKRAIEEAGLALTKPTIFVEGATDKKVIEKAIKAFFPSKIDKLEIFTPEKGGARAAVNYLQAWQLHQQHKADPVRAVAILDKDTEGHAAKNSMSEFPTSSKHIRAILLQQHGAALSCLPAGYKPIVDLEALLSDDMWKQAQADGHLEKRDGTILFGHHVPEIIKKQFLDGEIDHDACFAELSDAQRMRLESKFTLDGKIKASDAINSMDDAVVERELANLKPTLEKALEFLFPTSNQDELDL